VLTAWRGRVGGGESVAEILLHHLLPTGPQEGQGSVEVEQGVANAPRHDLDVIEDPNGCTDRGAWGWGVAGHAHRVTAHSAACKVARGL